MTKDMGIFKIGVVLIMALLLGNSAWGQTVIDFETAGAGYTPSATEGSGDTDIFNRSNPNIGGNSSYIWAVEDISLTDPTLTLDPINVSGASSFSFSIDMLTPNTNDWDVADELVITYSIDGGAYQNLMWVQSEGSATYNEPACLDLNFDTYGDSGQELPAITDGYGAGVGSNFETFSTGDISLSGNSTLDIKLQFNGLTSTAEGIYLDDITINTASSGPAITLSESSLTGFSYEEGSGPSAEQTFTVEGSNLTDDITLTAPTNYEISESSGSGFGSSVTLGQSGGSVSTTTIYVRLKSGLSIGTYSGETITASSSGATDQTVTYDGEVVCPSVSAPTATAASSAAGTSFTANWDAVSGATGYYLDVYQAGSALVETFTAIGGGTTSSYLTRSWTGDGGVSWTAYNARTDQVINTGDDAICLRDAAGSYLISDAISGSITSISFDVQQAYSGSGGQLTVKVLHGASFATETVVGTISYNGTASQFSESVSGITGDYKIRIDNNDLARAIIDNLAYGSSMTYITGYDPYDAGASTSATVSGLTAGETYYYVVRAYNDCGSESANSNEITVNLACSDPTTEATSLSFPATQYDQMDVSWTAGDGENHLVVASTSPITGAPADNTSYAADANFGDGATLNAGEYVVYAGSGNSFTITGLNSDTQYYIKVFEYNCDSGNEQYLTGSPLSGDETTVANIPAVTGFDVTCTTETTATVEWTNPSTGDWGGVIIAIRNSTNPVHTLSDDPTTVSADPVFGNGHEFGSTTPYSYVVYKGAGTSVTISGLTQGQDYTLKAISYYGSLIGDETTTTISSLEIAEVTAASATTENSQTNLSWSNPGACYDEILVVGHEGSSVTATPSGDGSAYAADGSFGAGTDIGTNEYVVYKGNSTSITVTNLTNGNSYYFTIFVRVGTEWSDGVEVIANPSEVTDFIPGDLAIIAVNTNYQGHATLGAFEEFTFVAFKDINVGTSIDFTENGWERSIADRWGTTEGAIRLTREAGGSVPAGTSITVVMHGINGTDASHFDIYINGTDELASGNWSITELNPTKGSGFNLNSQDDIWIMQGGSWIENDNSSSPSYHDDEYTGYVLYGWTATGWPGGDPAGSTEFSNLYPACECFNTNVSGLTNQDKVKYTGDMTDASKLDWINRFNDENNWTGYIDDAAYDAGDPDYRNNGISIGVLGGGFESGRWTASYNTDWFNCRNWQNLTVPDENTDVLVSPTYASGEAEVNNFNTENALCHDITVEPGIELDFHDNTLEVHGDFNNQAAVLGTWNSTLILAADEAVNITTNGVSMNNVTINGSGTFNLQDDLVLDGVLTLTNGVVSTGTNMLHVDNTDAAAITGHSAASYINGNLRRSADNTAATSYDFPVGDASDYQLATVDVSSATGLTELDAHFASADLGAINIGGLGLSVDGTPLVSVLDAGYWQVEPNSMASLTYDIILNERGASNAAPVAAQHAVVKRDDAVSDWELQGSHDNATQAINGSVVTAQVSGLSGFSQFAIARSNQFPLAVELTDFDASCRNGNVLLAWTTASEENSDYFRIEYAADAKSWKTIEKVLAFGTTNQQQDYQLLLEDVPTKGYFRLSEVDTDGTVTSYKPAYINCRNSEQAEFTLAPNPAAISTKLKAQNASADFYLVRINDMQGRLVQTLSWENPAEQALKLNLQTLQSGVYSVLIYNESEASRLKLVVSK
jgi:hypothetical protein